MKHSHFSSQRPCRVFSKSSLSGWIFSIAFSLAFTIALIIAGVVALASLSAFAQDTPTSPAIAAERLIIRFTQGVFLLEARQTVRKVLPPSDALPATQSPLSGFWYELRAGDGSVRYRRIIYNPLLLVFEGPAENSTDPTIVRDEALLSDHVFTLLIPAPATTDVLLIFSSPLELGAQAEPATEVARFTFEPIIP